MEEYTERIHHGLNVVLPTNLPGATKRKMEISVKTSDVPVWIRTEDLTHRSL
jgi:hypothetical protein